MEKFLPPDEQHESYWVFIRQVLTRLFNDLTDADWQKLASLTEEVDIPGGSYLFRQGDQGDALYIVIHGRLQVRRETGAQFEVIAEIGRGETVGEMALITGENRSAGIFAIRDCRLVRISKSAFNEFFTQFPMVGLNLAKLIIQRFTERRSLRRRRSIRNVAVIGLHRQIDLPGISNQLESALKKSGKKVRVLSSSLVDALWGAGMSQTGMNQIAQNQKLSIWLDNEEAAHDLVLYIADHEPSEWTKRCIRQADDILLFADAAEPPDLTPLEQSILSGDTKLSTAHQSLILLQQQDGIPSHTAGWLRYRNLDFHLHIRPGELERDFGRLSRYLTDRMIGLVLAGGGAKGFAHIGVWRALEEMKVPVDYIGGTSIGAFLGGIMAFDWDSNKIMNICRGIAFSPLKSDFNLLPVVSIFKGRILDRVLQQYYLEYEIEDCPLPFFCVSSNLTNAQPVIHHSGNMFQAIRASGSIPAVVPPVVDHHGLLIDGGIFNNFPTDIMVNMGAQCIIGVDFLVDQNKEVTYDKVPTNWQVLMSRWFKGRRSDTYPTLVGTILESTTLYSAYTQKQNSENTDIYINPEVDQFGMLEWRSFDKIVQKGYEKAMQVLEASEEQLEKFIH